MEEQDKKIEAVQTEVVGAKPEERQQSRRGNRGGRRGGNRDQKKVDSEFDTRIISIRRVSRSYKGGKRLRISVFVAVGDKAGRVGLGVGKGTDVRDAQSKATAAAKKNMIMVKLKGTTIPHDVKQKYGPSLVYLRPAAPGTGIIAGGSVRTVLEVAGVKDILSKILRSRNSINNAYATIEALKDLRNARL